MIKTLLILMSTATLLGCGQIDNGHVGIQTTFGKISSEKLPAGLYFYNPAITTLHSINIQVSTVTTESEAASKDLQIVHTAITLNYNISESDIVDYFKRLGGKQDVLEENIIKPATNETFKAVVAEFTAEDLINKRPEVSHKIESLLLAKLKQYNVNVDSISVTQFQFSKSFNDAIESKVTAQQNVLKAQNDLARIEVEAKQKIAQAEGQAKAMSLQKSIVTPELIQLKQIENQNLAIQKWNGALPQYNGTTLPFIIK